VREELRRVNIKGFCDLYQIDKAKISLATLYASDVGGMQARCAGKGFLRPAFVEPAFPNGQANCLDFI
jgi:hypothetical protein